MKTKDSVMREKYREIGAEIIRIAHKFGINEIDLAGELGTLSQLNKDLASHSLAEARREWVESVRNKKLLSIAKYGNMPAPHDPTYKEAYNQAIDDVVDLLTGDNPERK